MSSDSDDDFERFLQENDSESVSSASPVKKKVTKKSKPKSKADTTSKSKTSAVATSSITRRGSSGSSLSAVAAAEKLLAASGRNKAKPKQAIVEEDEDDKDEEPPPSYSEDPYAFELGAKSYLHHSDEEKKERDEDLYGSRSHASKNENTGRSSSKAAKKKTKETKKEREPPSVKREVKPAKTLEERVAEILKRTGSTTAMPTSAANEGGNDDDGEDERNGDDEDDGYREDDGEQANAKPILSLPGDSIRATTKSGMEDSEGSDRDGDGSDLHRLSFSDSLGMESADFEVGLHARRKLDRSRLSLSSLNSEKFAVNMDALEESELPTHNRYDRRDDDYVQSLGTSDAADGSEYGDDGFELDQTMDGVAAVPAPESKRETDRSVPSVEEPSSSMSEFEKMKKFFSVESPEKPPPANESIDVPSQQAPSEPSHQPSPSLPPPPPSPPLESDTFGYDDDDFETDEVKASMDERGQDKGLDHHLVGPSTGDDAYGDDGFEGDEHELADAVEQSAADPLHFVSLDNPPLEPMLNIPTVEVETPATVATTNATVPSVLAPDTVQPPSSLGKPAVPSPTAGPDERDTPTTNPPRPRSPPPPPPPEEDDPTNAKPPPLLTLPQSQIRPQILQPQRQVPHAVDRFREIDQQVGSLRFLRDSTRPPPSTLVARADSPVQVDVVEDAAMAEEMKEIEQLMKQARVRKERRRSVSVRSSAKESELALRLQQAQRQLLQFKHHVQELAERDDDDGPSDGHIEQDDVDHSVEAERTEGHASEGTPQKKKNGDVRETIATRKESDQLKKEIETQERLIQGFQRENEQLMKQLKQLQRDLHYDVHKENESLRVQLRELRTRFDRAPYSNREAAASTTDPEDKSQYRAAIEARLHAEAIAESLEEDLSAQTKRHQAAVNELKIELEKVKKAKIDLECQYEGLDLQKMENEIQQTKLLKDQIRMLKTEHDHSLAALQKKLDWYVANQRLLDDQDDKMKVLKEENEQLKRERESWNSAEKQRTGRSVGGAARSPITPGKPGAGRSAADIRRIQELETRLSEMEEAMRKRHPDSLVSLIVASRRAEEESTINELKKEHGQQLEALAEEMERAQANHEKKLNAFRQQQEKLVLQYQKQVSGLERQLAIKENQRSGGNGAPASNSGRNAKKPTTATTDETELYRVRRFYTEKIKELERKWEAKYRSLKKQQYAATGSGGGGAGDMAVAAEHDERTALFSSSSDSARAIRSLQQQVKAQEDELRRLRVASSGSDSRTQPTTSGWEISDLRRRVQSLEHQLKTSEDARRHLIETLTSLDAIAPSAVAAPVQDPNAENKTQEEIATRLQTIQNDHDTEVARYRQLIATLEQQVADQSTAAHTLRNQFSVHIKEVERLQTLLTEAEREKRMLQAAAERVPVLESEVSVLREQLAIPQTPSMLQFRSLELRIETLAQKHQLREAELKTMLVQATQSSRLEKLQYERMYEKALALKNHEILTFKKQLEEILDELELLRASQALSSI